MQRSTRFAMILALVCATAGPAHAGMWPVRTAAELQEALTGSQANGQDDVIMVMRSEDAYIGTFTYAPIAGENNDLTIEGGWSGWFGSFSREVDPANTILDGGGAGRTLALTCPNGTTGSITVEGLTIRNGVDEFGGGLAAMTAPPGAVILRRNVIQDNVGTSHGGGLYVSVAGPAAGGTVTLQGNVIRRNTCGPDTGLDGLPFAGGAYVLSTGTCDVLNNLIAENDSDDSNDYGILPGGKGGGMLMYAAGEARFINNTITGNNASSSGGGLYLLPFPAPYAAAHYTLANNIIRGNTYAHGLLGDQDLMVDLCERAVPVGHGIVVEHNDVEHIGYSWCSIGATLTDNIDLDPQFHPSSNAYHLMATSACVDAGDNAAVPAALTTDFEGQPRIFGYQVRDTPAVDIGWDEYYDGALELTAPLTPAVWLNDGTARTISWACTNIAGDVRLSLWRRDEYGDQEVLQIAAAVHCADGTFDWTPPADLRDGTEFWVRVASVLYPVARHWVGPVTIEHLRLLSPNGGQKLRQGATVPITWESGNLPGGNIQILLEGGMGGTRTVATSVPAAAGSFSWKIPYTLLPGSTYRIKLKSLGPYDLLGADLSDGTFSIVSALQLTAPNGGQQWKAGQAYPISWSYKGTLPGNAVDLLLYRKGIFVGMIATAVPLGGGGKGSYLWTIPATQTPSAGYKVRVWGKGFRNCNDESDKPFTIVR